MPSYNKVILMGNLTRDPELKQAGSGQVCDFGIATNRKSKEYEEVYYGQCTAWGQTGETIAKFFTKGKPILVEGRLKTEQWEDKDGKRQSATRLVVERFSFVGNKSDNEASASPASNAALMKDEDIPF